MRYHRTGDQEHSSICKTGFWHDLEVRHLGYRMFEFARRKGTGIGARMSSVLSFLHGKRHTGRWRCKQEQMLQ